MFFKQLLAPIWRFFDAICFVIGAIFANMFTFSFGNRWGWLGLAITLLIAGYISEIIAVQQDNKGGD
ncbi:DUF1056 family protein [Convivina intestini]|uniref:DUF1056 family protein n=1 Tax=Convivina intestini TaxID=1505726 RepID=UPI002010278B|nr:DUF1056 family protein [Convivina intestini]CAH1857519.1 hypothetical protein R077811_01548 [Convivina intestini]